MQQVCENFTSSSYFISLINTVFKYAKYAILHFHKGWSLQEMSNAKMTQFIQGSIQPAVFSLATFH